MSFGQFLYKGLHCQVMELLECNIRSVIFKNERQGLSPWATQKFARDVLTWVKHLILNKCLVDFPHFLKSQSWNFISCEFFHFRALASLHQSQFVHADLKPANIMWSSYDGRFKVLDFGLTFHTDEEDLHQIQSPGYKAPEVAEWNKYKDEMKKRRKRKLQGTYSDLTKAAPAYERGLQNIGVQGSAPVVAPISESSPIPSGASRTILRAPPRRNRLSGVFSASSDQGKHC